jgi:cation:H+ antiporter
MMASAILLLVLGLALLVFGAELLVRGAARLGAAAGVSPLVIGLTVVAYGTGTPELAVSVRAALAGQPDIALGTVVGSNTFNVLFVLGVSALVVPLAVASQLVRIDVPIMIGASVLTWLLCLDGRVDRVDGMMLTAGIVAYTVLLVHASRRKNAPSTAEFVKRYDAPAGTGYLALQVGLCLTGLGLLVLGARWLVDGAVTIARSWGVSELVVGLTIVAAGTSMPEVATSIVAAMRGERDIAVGNVVGSNVYNLFAILGLTGLVAPGGIPVSPAALRFDVPVMVAATVACLPIFLTGHRIARWEGALFLGYYVAYTLYLLLDSVGHDALPAYSAAMLIFVIPLTGVTLLVLLVRTLRTERAGAAGR